jgi:hypothetical protein
VTTLEKVGLLFVSSGIGAGLSFVKDVASSGASKTETDNLLGLSIPHTLDIGNMNADIGNESVPVVRENYDERNPTNGERATVSSTYTGTLRRHRRETTPASSTYTSCSFLYLRRQQSSCVVKESIISYQRIH